MDREVHKDHIVSQGLTIHNGRSLLDDPTAVHLKKTSAARRDLDDYILTEILCRLPSPKSAFRCKSVSKHWNSLISHRYFISRFIEHHSEKNNNYYKDDQFYLLFNYFKRTVYGTGFFATSSGHQGQRECFFPWTSYRVEGSFNDLLLCSDLKKDNYNYYIFNPFTKEHVELPMCKPCGFSFHQAYRTGFVCEPFYTQELGQIGLNAIYRYRVVRIVSSFDNCCSVETYCSETRQWSVQTSRGVDYRCSTNVVVHNGKLWWYNFSGKVVVHDPFVTTTTTTTGEPCFYFHSLNVTPSPSLLGRLQFAESQGSLLLMEITDKQIEAQSEVSIWKLKEKGHEDDHHESWCFERRVIINHIVSDTAPSFLRKPFYLMFCVDPSNQDVIFLSESESLQVASYNLVTKECKSIGEIQQFHLGPASYQPFGIPVTRQLWPTPVHRIGSSFLFPFRFP